MRFQKDVKSIRLRPSKHRETIKYMFQKDVKSIRLRPTVKIKEDK